MDDLDKHLAQLQLMNNAELPPNPGIPKQVSKGKKITPPVPPKPKKTQPQVPHSYSVKESMQPSYSSSLHRPSSSTSTSKYYSNIHPSTHSKSLSNTSTLPLGTSSSSTNLYGNAPHYSNVHPDTSHLLGSRQIPTSRSNLQGSNLSLSSNLSSVSQNLGPKGYNKPDQHVTYSNVQVGGSRRGHDDLTYSNLRRPPPENTVYSNLPHMSNLYSSSVDDLPPPPPPIELAALPLSDYAPCTLNMNFPPPPDELPLPPSPVSSSYSELRRATEPPQDFNLYGSCSQSSTYESIYEPINPRPPSQMSSRSNYSLYAPYVSGGSNMSGPSQSASRIGGVKEEEVDVLTDLLVQGLENDPEGDCYGICVKCKQKVVGENSGCTAMDQIYHTACFTCHQCAINLQGKPFYSVKGKPYCEEDYFNTLEKCSVCLKPILDRMLRATGKPYHPDCFCCVVCGESLDGIPFTVDYTNQIHCIEDFHKRYAPKCSVCKQPIMPEPGQEETVRVVALDRSFHIKCYKCEDCGLVLSSEAEGRGCYPLDDHVLCKSCNAKRIQALTRKLTTEL